MDDLQAIKILNALANGANPLTGEMFADDSVYQSPPIIRALFVALRALESSNTTVASTANADVLPVDTAKPQKEEGKVTVKTNAGKPWSGEEDKALLAAFDAQQSIAALAKTHGRTQNGVRARLEKHGRLPPTEARWSQTSKPASQPGKYSS